MTEILYPDSTQPNSGQKIFCPYGIWERVQCVEVRFCLTVRQSLTSIVGVSLISTGITSFGCPHRIVYNDQRTAWMVLFRPTPANHIEQRTVIFIFVTFVIFMLLMATGDLPLITFSLVKKSSQTTNSLQSI